MRLPLKLALLLTAAMAAGCADDPESAGPVERPVATGERVALGQVSSGTELTSPPSLVIDLDRAPDPQTAALTACHAVLPPDFVIGEARCEAAPERRMTLQARHARQICSSKGAEWGAPIEREEAPGIDGCSVLAIEVFRFEPALAIHVAR